MPWGVLISRYMCCNPPFLAVLGLAALGWVSEQVGLITVCIHDGASEQPAPTIHQSLIRNNSTADSSHKILPKQTISLPDNVSDLSCVLRLHTPQLTCSTQASQLHLLSVCVQISVGVYEPAVFVCITFDPQGRLEMCFSGKRREMTLWFLLTDHVRHKNVLRISTVYMPVWGVTQGGRRMISLGMNYGYHMSKAGAHSWARVLFKDG